MNKSVYMLIPVAILLLSGSASATFTIPSGSIFDCGTLFSTTQISSSFTTPLLPNTVLTQAGTYTSLLQFSLLIVLMVLTVLGIVYAIGRAFNINKLTTFATAEALESVANIIIIVIVIVGGFGLFDGTAAFIANLASAGTGSTVTLTNSNGVFVAACNNVENGMIISNLYDYFYVFINLFVYDALISFTVKLQPNQFGVTFQPWNGVQTLRTTIWAEEAISFSFLGMGAMIIMLLWVIYFLFPVFFYIGIFLRSFPWTRAAGGAMMALFISFYIVFPAFVYGFSNVGQGTVAALCPASNPNPTTTYEALCDDTTVTGKLLTGGFSFAEGLFNSATSIFGLGSFGDALYENVVDFTNLIGYSIVQVIGVVISLIISYDLLEALGDFLGAPSLQSNRILSKVI